MGRTRFPAVFAAACLLAPALAHAQDLGTSRRVQGTTDIKSVEVGDAPGHVVGVVEFRGLTFFANGEIATHSNPATFDLTNGSGPHQGYVLHRFDDGSTSLERYQGEAKPSADGGNGPSSRFRSSSGTFFASNARWPVNTSYSTRPRA